MSNGLSACPWAYGKRLWKEDECLLRDPDAEHLHQAWRRLFGEALPTTLGCLEFDGGDHYGYLMPNGATVVISFDGNEIWSTPEVTP